MKLNLITTTFELPGYSLVESLGVVEGYAVKFFSEHKARKRAFDLMVKHAEELGADAIVGLRYEIIHLTHAFVYGTAVIVKKQ